MAGILKHLAFQIIVVDLGDLLFKILLLSISSDDSKAIEGL
jgi:hypothetical protein